MPADSAYWEVLRGRLVVLGGCCTLTKPDAMRGRLLVVDEGTPTPDLDSGSACTFTHLRILASAGFNVTFVAPDLAHAGRYTQALNDLGIVTPTTPEWTSFHEVVESLAPRSDILLLYRGEVASGVFDLARRAAPGMKIVFHPVDLHFLRLRREATVTGDLSWAEYADKMRVIELYLVGRADATIVVSSYELGLLADLVPQAVVHLVPILRETPTLLPSASLSDRRDIVFIGGFGHRPNVDAVQWFVRKVWPRILAKGFPERFIIAGSRMPPELAELASDRIEARGYVAELGALFVGCRLSVAPLRYGGGSKGKIVTSLSYGVPVVASPVAVEGMDLVHEENVLVAEGADETADQIIRLYREDSLWRRLASDGVQTFRTKFSEASGAANLVDIFNGLMAHGRERS